MKKFLKYSLACLAGTAIFASCTDVMDTKPVASYDEELVWGSEETINGFILGCYNNVLPYFTGSYSWESMTPNGILCSQVSGAIDTWASEQNLSSGTDAGFGRFSQLRACNKILQMVPRSPLTEAKKKELIAEGHLLRGMLFFDMARKMGRFVPVKEVLTQDDVEKFKMPLTASIAESYRLVMEDLDVACADMPETSDAGRANRYAALLIRSRAALQAYAYTGDATYLDVAVNSADEVIKKYPLNEDYRSLFINATTGGELIWSRYYLSEDFSVSSAKEMVNVMPNLPPDNVNNAVPEGEVKIKNATGQTFECWAEMFPTQDLVDQYLVIDQKDGKAKEWDKTSQFLDNVDVMDTSAIKTVGQIDSYTQANGWKRNIPSNQDLVHDGLNKENAPLFRNYYKVKEGKDANISDLMYQHRDKRMDATILRDGSEFMKETLTMKLDGNASQGVRDKEDGGWYNTMSGYYWAKGVPNALTPRYIHNAKTDYHYVVCRAGEAYMNLAEALLLKNDIPNAVKAINKTRKEHGGLPGSEATTKAEAWKDYIRERRVEMAYENGDIYYSYLRWGKYGGDANYNRESAVGEEEGAVIKDLNWPVYKIQISRDRKKVLIGQCTLLASWNRNFTSRRYLFPIPQGAIDQRKLYGIVDTQNAGW